MLVPFGIFNTVFTAVASLGMGIILTAEHTQTTVLAKLDAVFIQTFVTLLADDAALLAVEVAVGANIISTVAVSALVTVHQLQLPTTLAEAASIAKTAHTVGAEPAVAA